MKKVLLCCLACILSMSLFAQAGILDGSVCLKGGYNIQEKKPIAMVTVFADFAFVRFQVESGILWYEKQSSFGDFLPYMTPSIGASYGDKNTVFLLIGLQPNVVEERAPRIKMVLQPRIELGYDISLSKRYFISLGAFYLIPYKESETLSYHQNFSVIIGVGYRIFH